VVAEALAINDITYNELT